MIEVRLPIELWRRGEAVGLRRDQLSRDRGGKPRFSYGKTKRKRTSAETHVYGARGEAAFAHALGLDWAGPVDTFTEVPDVEPNWEIRTTDSEYRMKVAPSDNPKRLVAFVLNEWGSPTYQILGFIIAGWAQEHLRLEDPNNAGAPAHWVRYYSLSPIDPGFHAVHGWIKNEQGSWVCAFCPERF